MNANYIDGTRERWILLVAIAFSDSTIILVLAKTKTCHQANQPKVDATKPLILHENPTFQDPRNQLLVSWNGITNGNEFIVMAYHF